MISEVVPFITIPLCKQIHTSWTFKKFVQVSNGEYQLSIDSAYYLCRFKYPIKIVISKSHFAATLNLSNLPTKLLEYWKNQNCFSQIKHFLRFLYFHEAEIIVILPAQVKHAIMWSDGSLAVYQWRTDKDSFVVLSVFVFLRHPLPNQITPRYRSHACHCLIFFFVT